MAVTSPTSASPGQSLLEWDEAAVHSYLSHIGLSQYETLIQEHGITGDVLAVMDHSTLQDLGINSVGHRLNLLRAVWELKREQGIAIGEDDWRPQEDGLQVDKLWDLIVEQQDRLINLERDHSRLLSTLEDNGVVDGLDKSAAETFPRRRNSQLFPSSLASSTASNIAPPLTSDSSTFQNSFTPTTAAVSYPFDSPSNDTKPSSSQAAKPAAIQPPPFTRLMSGSSLFGANASSPPASGPPQSIASVSKPPQPTSQIQTQPPAPPTTQPEPSADKSKARDAARNAAKSFRVTLEDPCWKVLPAALKKYKINDDWKMYALFICFGNTERCLSYDEKPLMLFQKLKEGGQRPVFMLRHMRDIKSPIAVAQQKQAVKLGLPANSTQNVLPKIKPASDTSTSPTKATSLQPARRNEEGQTPAGGTFPELPSPGLRDGDAMSSALKRTLVDKDGKVQNVSYAVAIYPYIADRQDEFDVAVGATYVILSKAKGWYIVQRDPDGLGGITPDQSKSGWVPAGCLLELHTPIAVLSPNPSDAAYPGLAAIPPAAIVSSSYPGNVLMDWEAKAEDQVTLKEGEKVRVYKKYCHWSYTIKQDTGDRGWVPAWFIGKSIPDSQPNSAATPTGPGAMQTPSTGSAGSVHKDEEE